MGLDMYAYRTRAPIAPVDFEEPDDAEEIMYWRKHPDLHGWMERLYRDKDGQKSSFNLVPVKLDWEDLDMLERHVKMDALPPTTGFFFGVSRPEEKNRDLGFIAAARAAIEAGYSVYYTSWW